MNVRWLAAGGVIGALVGLAMGYVSYRATAHNAFDFFVWTGLDESLRHVAHSTDALAWMIGGIIVGVAATFLPLKFHTDSLPPL